MSGSFTGSNTRTNGAPQDYVKAKLISKVRDQALELTEINDKLSMANSHISLCERRIAELLSSSLPHSPRGSPTRGSMLHNKNHQMQRKEKDRGGGSLSPPRPLAGGRSILGQEEEKEGQSQFSETQQQQQQQQPITDVSLRRAMNNAARERFDDLTQTLDEANSALEEYTRRNVALEQTLQTKNALIERQVSPIYVYLYVYRWQRFVL